MQKKQYTQPKVLVVDLKPEERLACCNSKSWWWPWWGCNCNKSTASFS